MNELFPIILSMIIFSAMIGLLVGLFAATSIYSKQNKTVLRLKNIEEVAASFLNGDYGENAHVAMSFIACESDLNIRKEEDANKKKS